jgi:nicotinamidase-related amidase
MQNTAILCIDIWNYHHCKSIITKTNNLVKKLNPFLEQCYEKSIPIIHMHDQNLPDKYNFLRLNCPSLEQQEYYINNIIQSNNNFYKNFTEKLDPLNFNIPIPKCGKTAICECDSNRSCFLKIHPYFKDKMSTYNELIKNKSKLKDYCRENKIKKDDPYQQFQSIHPNLKVNQSDVYLFNLCELYAYLIENNISNIIYVGGAGNLCISWTREYSMFNMKQLGFNTYYIKDYVFNISGNGFDSDINDEDEKYTQEYFDDMIFATIEKYYGKSIHQTDVLSNAKLRN